jgi:hypothetical protein
MSTTYHLYGSVRGSCGHKHKSIEAARRCYLKDSKGCKFQGGYSDMKPFVMENGKSRGLTQEEYDRYMSII